ncbi:MAG TPA: hypothetical protein VM940_16345 [Chthoniobacterales bacterium]|nr:hypothetical protein [Chthoniobacterales bacterium]
MKSTLERPSPRQIFVLTAEELRIICFVLVAFVLGLAVKHYRSTHPGPAVIKAVGESARHVSEAPAKKLQKRKAQGR